MNALSIRQRVLANIGDAWGTPLRQARGGTQTYIDPTGVRHVVRVCTGTAKRGYDQFWWNLTPQSRADGDLYYFAMGGEGYLCLDGHALNAIADGFHADGTRPTAIVRHGTHTCEIYVGGHLRDVSEPSLSISWVP